MQLMHETKHRAKHYAGGGAPQVLLDLLQGPLVAWSSVDAEHVDGREELLVVGRRRPALPRGAVDGLQVGQHEGVNLGAIVFGDSEQVS
eukprot:5536482-Pyramimonas_sp.AAC.1